MKELKDLIIKTLDDKKARNIVDIDFKNENPLYDAFIVCDAPSMRQVQALSLDVEGAILEAGYKVKTQERQNDAAWVLIDAIDVIVHIFLTEERERYNLEKLYQDYVNEDLLR